jgi:hypothetical protein
MPQMILPDDSQRLVLCGKSGSGKTQAATWHLSLRSFDRMPWLVYDFKFDPLLNSIAGLQTIEVGEIPQHPGLFICHPRPDETEAVQAQMWAIWEKGSIGIYIDEGYMVGDTPAFRALLTQGRTKIIPMIVGVQRPTWVTRFLFTEADFFQVFLLADERDMKTVEGFTPPLSRKRLPPYWSYYYEVARDRLITLKPVPDAGDIRAAIEERLMDEEDEAEPQGFTVVRRRI